MGAGRQVDKWFSKLKKIESKDGQPKTRTIQIYVMESLGGSRLAAAGTPEVGMRERDARLRYIQGTRLFPLHPFPSIRDGKSLQSQHKRRDPGMLTSGLTPNS